MWLGINERANSRYDLRLFQTLVQRTETINVISATDVQDGMSQRGNCQNLLQFAFPAIFYRYILSLQQLIACQ